MVLDTQGTAPQPTLKLNDGRIAPQLGLGVWRTAPEETAGIVRFALQAGYRSVDTAAVYRNEIGVGEGVRTSGLPREEVFVTTKLWNDHQGYDRALDAFDKSLGRLGLDYVDLYLIHWPTPQRDLYVDTWRALVSLQQEGRARSIGVSNFKPEHLERIVGETGVTPAVNQVELHPRHQQAALRAADEALGVVTQSWSPLGQGGVLNDPTITAIADKYGRTPAQVVIRWHLDQGLMTIPKSANPARISENLAVFDFALDGDDLTRIATMDAPGGRIGPDPADFN